MEPLAFVQALAAGAAVAGGVERGLAAVRAGRRSCRSRNCTIGAGPEAARSGPVRGIADHAAAAAVVDVRLRVRLAAVGSDAVAVAPAGVAREHLAGAAATSGRRVGQRADVVARPQLPMLVLVLVSQPLPVLPSQSA